jgi:DNA-directed RNA polymerase subunit F
LDIAADEFGKALQEAICTDNPLKEAEAEIRITWLAYAVGMIGSQEERKRELLEILEAHPPELREKILEIMPQIAKEVAPLLPVAG